MKRIFYGLCLWLLIFFSEDATGQLKFSINGHINNSTDSTSKTNLGNGDFLVLKFLNLPRKDTVSIRDNSFHFSGEVPYPSIAMLEYKYGGNLILLDNSAYQFDLTLVRLDSVHREYVGEIITHSSFFNAWKDFYRFKKSLTDERNKLNTAFQQNTNPDSSLYYSSAIKEADGKIIAAYHKLAADHPNSYITAYILQGAPDFTYDKYIDIYNSFSGEIKNSFYGKNFYSRLMTTRELASNDHAVEVNIDTSMFPVTAGIDTSLKKVMLDKPFFSKHQYTLIEFWASWCGPCRAVNERLKDMKQQLKRKDVALVGFSLDQAAEAWKLAVINDNTPWLQISDLKATNSPLSVFLRLTTIPANVLVDRNGKIVRTNIYESALENFLKGVN